MSDLVLESVTLLALKAIVPNAAEVTRSDLVLWLPSRAPMPRDEARARLARLSKPVGCVALSALGILAVGAWTLDDPLSRSIAAAAGDKNQFDRLSARFVAENDSRKVILCGHGESMIVDVEVVRDWYASYVLLCGNTSISTTDPLAREAGVGAAMRFSRQEPPEGLSGGMTRGRSDG